MTNVISITKHPRYQRNIRNTCKTMTDQRLSQYAAWWQQRDAEMYTAAMGVLLLRRAS